MSDDTATFYPTIKQLFDDKHVVLSVAFGFDGAYFARTISGSVTSDQQMARKDYSGGAERAVPARWASFGGRGVWVVVDEDDTWRSQGLAPNVIAALYRRRVRVSNRATCLTDDELTQLEEG